VSNTESAQTQWRKLAESIGFVDEKSMWQKLYTEEKRTIAELSKTLGFGTACIQRRIKLNEIETRTRGGAVAPSRIYIKLFHLDQRYVRTAEPSELAKLLGASVHSVYRLRREV
jgi:hypothetical protein